MATQAKPEAVKPSAKVRYWLNEINDAKKREKDYRKEGQRIREIYAGKKKDNIPFNILFSNTETLSPALYSSTPKPVVQRRFKDDDPVGKAASVAGQRCLEFLIDTNLEDYETFDGSMSDATLDALLPGRGITRVKYDAEVVNVPDEDPADDADEADAQAEAAGTPAKTWEIVCTETVEWDRVYFGFAKRWSKMPWIAFEHYLDRGECARLFGQAIASRLVYTKGEDKDSDSEWDGPRRESDSEDQGDRKTCLVYELWDKKKKRVVFLSPRWQGDYLKEEEDPLELSGFFPIPKPMQFIRKTGDLIPTALYLIYENQATELNRISTRINRVVQALKVRGAYDGSLGDTFDNLLKADDNTMVPTSNASNIALEGGLEKRIWFMPLDILIKVLQQLLVSRDQAKQVIYEITGIADILRGTSDANETLGAQQIKNQWASMRIKVQQNEVRRYVRETLRIMLEIAAKKFSPETFAQMTGLPFVTEQEKAQAGALLAAQQQAGMQLDPQAQKVMQTPSWEQVIALLNNDLQRAYRIDIETNSTIEVNEMEDKQNVAEALQAMGTFVESVGPLVERGVMPFEAAQSILLAIVRRFRFGTEVEEQVKTMKAPPPKPDPRAAEAEAQMQAERAKAEMQSQADRAAAQEKMAAEAQRAEVDRMIAQDKLAADQAVEEIRAQADVAKRQAEIASEERLARERMAMEERLTLEKAAMEVSGKVLAETIKAHEAQETMAQERAEGAAHEAAEMNPANIMQQVLAMQGEMLMAIKATRKRTPVRSPDGEIEYTLEEPM